MKVFIFVDKIINYYEVDKIMYDKLIMDNIILIYKKVNINMINVINNEVKDIVINLNIVDWVECMVEW